MTKILGLTSMVLGSLILSGCGGNSTRTVSDSKNILIIQNTIKGICESTIAREELSKKLTNLITKELPSGALCSDFNKIEGENCVYEDDNEGNVDCAVGFDDLK